MTTGHHDPYRDDDDPEVLWMLVLLLIMLLAGTQLHWLP